MCSLTVCFGVSVRMYHVAFWDLTHSANGVSASAIFCAGCAAVWQLAAARVCLGGEGRALGGRLAAQTQALFVGHVRPQGCDRGRLMPSCTIAHRPACCKTWSCRARRAGRPSRPGRITCKSARGRSVLQWTRVASDAQRWSHVLSRRRLAASSQGGCVVESGAGVGGGCGQCPWDDAWMDARAAGAVNYFCSLCTHTSPGDAVAAADELVGSLAEGGTGIFWPLVTLFQVTAMLVRAPGQWVMGPIPCLIASETWWWTRESAAHLRHGAMALSDRRACVLVQDPVRSGTAADVRAGFFFHCFP